MINKKKPKFLRRGTVKLLKLGKRKKKKQKWRRARGRHNKIRKELKSHRKKPSVGYSAQRKTRGYIKNLKPLLIKNIKDIEKATNKNIIIISKRIGKKKRAEILRKIEEKKLQVNNIKKIKDKK
jgi:large subunit ribosomal protein L32e